MKPIRWTEARAIPILRVAEDLGIRLRGTKAMCFAGHDRKTPSLSFRADKNDWHCFGCGLRGSTIDLVSGVLQISPRDAVEWLTHRYLGSQGTRAGGRPYAATSKVRQIARSVAPMNSPAFSPDPEIYQTILELCHLLKTGQQYLESRGFLPTTIEKFQIREIDDAKTLEVELKRRFDLRRLIRCGVLRHDHRRAANGKENFTLLWWDRTILFPFFENTGPIYIQGRRLAKTEPRYLGLQGIPKPMFNASVLAEPHASEPPLDSLYICEGVTDTMAATQLGWKAIGILGARSFRKEWARALLEFDVTVVPDADKAGRGLYHAVRAALGQFGRSVEGLILPEGTDLADSLLSKAPKR